MKLNSDYHIISKWFRNFVHWGQSEPLIPPHKVLSTPYLAVVSTPAESPFKIFLLWAETVEDAAKRFETVKQTHLVWEQEWSVSFLEVDRSEVYDLDPLSITYLTPEH